MLGFAKHKKASGLESLNRNELDRERIRLEHSEKRLTREIEEREVQKEKLFREGTGSVSDRQRMALARKLREVEAVIQGLDKQLALLARNQQVINSLILLADGQKTVSTLGLDSVLKSVDLEAVKDFVDRTHAEHELASGRFQALTASLTTFDSVTGSGNDDADTLAIVEAMQRVAHRGDGSGIADGLAQVTQQIRAKSPESFSRF